METQLRPLPQCATKSQLMDWYLKSNYTADVIRKGINEIISEVRGIPIDKAKFAKNVRPAELSRFVKRFDAPVGFKI